MAAPLRTIGEIGYVLTHVFRKVGPGPVLAGLKPATGSLFCTTAGRSNRPCLGDKPRLFSTSIVKCWRSALSVCVGFVEEFELL